MNKKKGGSNKPPFISTYLKAQPKSNVMKFLASFVLAFSVLVLNAQTFTDQSTLVGDGFNSGGCVGVVDMDGDGLDDVMILDQSRNLHVAYQETDGTYSFFSYGQVSSSQQWGAVAADVDEDGHKDLISGGAYDGVHVEYISSRGNSTSANLNNGSMFMQACNIVDINNDGSLDFFGCHDDALSRTWENDGTGGLTYNGALMDLLSYDFSAYPSTDHSGNYGTVWSDFDDDGDVDLYLAKCRQGVTNANDPRRINQLWVNDGNGNYTEEAASRGLVLLQQSWTADFADVDNDGDMDCLVTNHTGTLKLLENDGTGNFTDVTGSAGIGISGFFLQAKMEDMDNDGFVDIIYAGGLDGYFHNDGDGTFTSVAGVFPYTDTMHSFALGDLNNDGHMDLYASYGQIYVGADLSNDDILWLNDGNANNWVSFDLTGIFSNLDAIGAKVKIYGDWGVQVREVRAGESYGMTNSSKCHFGLGTSSSITSVEVIWPSGTVTTIDNPDINTVHEVIEAPCLVDNLVVTVVGSTQLCDGQTVTLEGPVGYEAYDWSTGESTQSIVVSAAGNYSLIATDIDGCVGISEDVNVVEVVPEPASVEVLGETEICEGSFVELVASDGTDWLWSNGETTQSIMVSSSANLSVNVTDVCGNVNSSPIVGISAYPVPGPNVSDQNVDEFGVATFSGDDTDLLWYDTNDVLALPIAVGQTYTTPVLTESTPYWVENPISYGGVDATGGRSSQGVDGAYHTNSNNWLLFDAYEEYTLVSVKVFANGAGTRTIQMIDDQGTEMYSSAFSLSDGENIVTLNWLVPVGTGYGLRTLDGNPQLWRDATGTTLNYPYDLGGVGAITSSSIVGANQFNYYYFFYDWVVNVPPTECVSERVQVWANVGIQGCTDPGSCNYNPDATEDDGSCIFDPCPNDCPADINNSGSIGTDDLVVLLSAFGCTADCGNADITGDFIVNSADLVVLLSEFGSACE